MGHGEFFDLNFGTNFEIKIKLKFDFIFKVKRNM